MAVEARSFHPMRGHVAHGESISFSDGRTLTLKNVGMRWELQDDAGTRIGRQAESAHDLTVLILELEAA